MRLLLCEIEAEGSTVDRELSQTWLQEVLRGAGSVEFRVLQEQTISVKARRVGLDVVLEASFSLRLAPECAACTREFEMDVPVTFSLDLKPKPQQRKVLADELELTALELDDFFYEGDAIDLEEILREQVLLALPMYPRCSTECKGLCSVCGANLNQRNCGCDRRALDPRLAVLQAVNKH